MKVYLVLRRLVLSAVTAILTVAPIINAAPLQAADLSVWSTDIGLQLQQQEVTTIPDRTENELCTKQVLTVSVVNQGIPGTQTGSDCVVQTNFGVVGHDYMVLGTGNVALHLEATGTPILIPHNSSLFVAVDTGFTGSYVRVYNYPVGEITRQISNNSWGAAYRATSPADWTVTDSSGRPIPSDAWAASANGQWLVFRSDTKLVRLNTQTRQILAFTGELPPYGSIPAIHANLAVSNDGRYVAYSGANTNKFLMFDLATCATGSDASLTVPSGCGRLDLTAYMRAHVTDYRDSRYFAFSDDVTQLDLYNTAAEGTKLYRATLSSPVYVAPQTLSYLGLGDSFSSGEGEIDNQYYLPGTDGNGPFQPGIQTTEEKCHISSRSYPFLLKQQMGLTGTSNTSVACSGAVMSDIANYDPAYFGQFNSLSSMTQTTLQTAKQEAVNQFIPGRADQIAFVAKYKPAAVTLTIGGNDLGFGSKLQECATSVGTCSYAAASQDRANMGQEIRSQFEPLKRLYAQLHQASPTTKIYVVGYPQFVADPGSVPVCNDSNAGMLDNTERAFIRQSVSYFNSVIHAAADAAHVTYVNIEDSLGGKQLCDGASTASAVNGIRLGNDIYGLLGNESYHPNPVGHSIIAEAIRQQVGDLLTYDCASSCPAAPATAPSLPIYFLIDGSALVIPKQTPLTTIRRINKDISLTLPLSGGNLAPNSSVTISAHSTPTDIAAITTDPKGNFEQTVSLPSTISSGVHTIHVLGTAPSGETVDLYQPLYVDEPVVTPPPTPDPDPTPTPDPGPAPDPTPVPVPPLYRVRNGDPIKLESPNKVYIERNVAQAAAQLGITDYDADNDGWALVGVSTGLNHTGIPVLYMQDATPLAILDLKKKGCSALAPDLLTPVLAGKPRTASITTLPSDATCQ